MLSHLFKCFENSLFTIEVILRCETSNVILLIIARLPKSIVLRAPLSSGTFTLVAASMISSDAAADAAAAAGASADGTSLAVPCFYVFVSNVIFCRGELKRFSDCPCLFELLVQAVSPRVCLIKDDSHDKFQVHRRLTRRRANTGNVNARCSRDADQILIRSSSQNLMLDLWIIFFITTVVRGDSITHVMYRHIGCAVLDGVSGRESVTILNICIVKMSALDVLLKTPLIHCNAGGRGRKCRSLSRQGHFFDPVDDSHFLVVHIHHILQISNRVIAFPRAIRS